MPSAKLMRRANGTGSLRRKIVRKGGREYEYWEGRVTVGVNPTTGKQVQKSITGKSQREVAKQMTELAYKVGNGLFKPAPKMTLKEWLDIWTSSYLTNIKLNTRKSYQGNIDRYIVPHLGKVGLNKLTTMLIQNTYADILKSDTNPNGVSSQSLKIIHSVLHSALQQAVASGVLQDNPSSACVLPKAPPGKSSPLPDSKIPEFLEAIRGNRYENLLIVSLFTGLRRSEITGLTWDRVDFDNMEILVDRQLMKDKSKKGLGTEAGYNGIFFQTPKSGKARTVPMTQTVYECLKKERELQLQRRKSCRKIVFANPDADFVFSRNNGLPYDGGTILRTVKEILIKIGCPDSTLHDLRHTYATLAIGSGADIKTVQETLGHHSSTFTLNKYVHSNSERKALEAQKLEGFVHNLTEKQKIS